MKPGPFVPMVTVLFAICLAAIVLKAGNDRARADHEETVANLREALEARGCEVQKAYRAGLYDGLKKTGREEARAFVDGMPPIPGCIE